MSNLTVTIDEELLRRARLRALEQGTSINALLRSYLESFAGANRAGNAAAQLIAMSERAGSGSGQRGRTWTRDQAHER